MGVYKLIYTPVFSFSIMSKEIQNLESGNKTNQPKLYKRGNEDINLDTFTNEATIALQSRLANSRLKDKEKKAVQSEFARILQGMHDGTFTYKIGGGYDNTIGMTNASKGFDAAGIAAGILGDVLRSQSTYTPPEDSSKIKWGSDSFKTFLSRQIGGSDDINVKDFVRIDYDPKTKKVSNNAKRTKALLDALNYGKSNFDQLFTNYSDTNKSDKIRDIDSAIKALEDGKLTENEYLTLRRATGFSNIEDLFSNSYETSNTQPTTTTKSPAPPAQPSLQTQPSTQPILNSNPLNLNRSVTSSTIVRREDLNKLGNIIKSLSKEKLFKILSVGISSTSANGIDLATRIPEIKKIFGAQPKFDNNLIISGVLEQCRRQGYLHQFDENSNNYYIPFENSVLKSRNAGIIYTISADGSRKLTSMDRSQIPYFNTDSNNYAIQSKKQGGVLKFQKGGSTDMWSVVAWDPTRYQNYKEGNEWKLRERTTNAEDSPEPTKYKPENLSGTTEGYKRGAFTNISELEKSAKYQTWINQLKTNDNLLTNWLNKYVELRGQDADQRVTRHRKADNTWDLEGARNSLFNDKTGLSLDHKLGIAHDIQQGKVYYIDGQPETFYGNTLEGYTEHDDNEWDESGLVKKIRLTRNLDNPSNPDSSNQNTKQWELFESGLPKPKDSTNLGNILSNISPDLISAGRLWASLHTNRNVYNAVLPSLKPVIQDPIDIHRQILGNFPAKQEASRRGAEVVSTAYRNADADANRNAARMLDAQKVNVESNIKGNLVDNDAIKKSIEDQFNLRKWLTEWNKTNVYMPNRVSINKTDRERAQLLATKLKSNWQSWDNFLSGLESRIRTRMDENRERANNFYDKIDADNANRLYENYQNEAYAAAQAWRKENPNADITEWSEYPIYKSKLQEAKERAESIMYANMAKRYGLNYNSPWTKDSNDLFFDRGWRGRLLT